MSDGPFWDVINDLRERVRLAQEALDEHKGNAPRLDSPVADQRRHADALAYVRGVCQGHIISLGVAQTRISDPRWINEPIPLLLWCPECGARHIDEGEFATRKHHSHSCQTCGMTWRPAVVATVGVKFLPGFGPKEAHEPPL